LATHYDEKPEPTGRTIVLQRDEMWHDLKNKRGKLWMWKAIDRDTGQLLDWECGRRDKKTLQKRVDRLAQWDVKTYCTDKWATSPSATANPPFQSQQAQLESGVRGNVPAPFGAGERLQSPTYRYRCDP
jgi:IS1 transposase